MITTMSISFTTKKQIHTPARRDRFYELMVHGTSRFQAAAASAGLSSTKQRLAENVLPVHSAQNHRRKD